MALTFVFSEDKQLDRDMSRFLKNNFSKYLKPFRFFVMKELADEDFIGFCRDIEQQSFDWQQHSKCSLFARFEFNGERYYIKKFRNRDILEPLKSLFKGSRALREFKGNRLLQKNGVKTPITTAIIEKRNTSYIITKEIHARTSFLQFMRNTGKTPAKHKSAIILLAQILAKLHKKNIILGDINMNNALVSANAGQIEIYILDNERTRKPLFVSKGKVKNLVQLNKIVDKKVTKTDRLRFYKIYIRTKGKCVKKENIRYINSRTQKRREKT